MTRKTHKPKPKEVPPPADSLSSEETEESSEEEEEAESEEHSPPPVDEKKVAAPDQSGPVPGPAKPLDLNEADSSGSEEESESDSGSDSAFPLPATIQELKAKYVSSHPVKGQAAASKADRPKKAVASSPSPAPVLALSAKRSAQLDEKDVGRGSKKPRKEEAEVVGSEIGKKASFQRLWSDEDEIIILNGMVEYYEKKGRNPMTCFDDFFDFVRGSLHVEVNRSQIYDKIRRMRKKFEKSLGKKKVMNDHERRAFNLSAKLWRGDGGISSATREIKNNEKSGQPNATSKTTAPVDGDSVPMSPPRRRRTPVRLVVVGQDATMEKDVPEKMLAASMFVRNEVVSMGLSDVFVQEGLKLIDPVKKSEWEDKRRQLNLEEAELYLKKMGMVQELVKLVAGALKSIDE